VDAGLSRKETFERLASIGVAWESIDAILVTHEHTDHVSGLAAIAGKMNDGPRRVPAFISAMTAPAISWGERVPPIEFVSIRREFHHRRYRGDHFHDSSRRLRSGGIFVSR